MRRYSWCGLGLAVVVTALGGLQYQAADGCAALPPLGRYIAISNETAIILWDEEKQVEHFIRSATFETDAENFGFLVPTPSQPTLHEVDQGSFGYLAQVTAPKVIYRNNKPRSYNVGFGCSAEVNKSVGSAPNAEPSVRVLEEKRVAGHDAAVLEADDAESLAAWLKEHEFPSSPELSDWLKPYIVAKWKITAFKFASEGVSEPKLSSEAIRLTFKTEKPLYPYREPKAAKSEVAETAPTQSRLLRVYFLAKSRYAGTLGEEGKPWSAETAWAGELADYRFQSLQQKLKLEDLGESGWWLTEFEDSSSPRDGENDLYFSPASTPTAIERPPVYASHTPRGDVTVYLIAVGVLGLYAMGARRRAKS